MLFLNNIKQKFLWVTRLIILKPISALNVRKSLPIILLSNSKNDSSSCKFAIQFHLAVTVNGTSDRFETY